MTKASDEMAGENCTDEYKRSMYLGALRLKVDEEHAKAAHDKALGAYRAHLKKAKAGGMHEDAIPHAIKHRHDDPDELLIAERERIKMLDLCGKLPNIKQRLFERLDVEEATTKETTLIDLANAEDLGAQAGRAGFSRDTNPHFPGTELYVHWVEGWLSGQRAIADEMEKAAVGQGLAVMPKKGKPGRPKKSERTPGVAPDPRKPSLAAQFEPPENESVGEFEDDEFARTRGEGYDPEPPE